MTTFCYRSCAQCGKTFVARHPKAKFCDPACRQQSYRDAKKPKHDDYKVAETCINALNFLGKQKSLKSLFLKIASLLDEKTFLGAYLQIRERGETERQEQKLASIVTNDVTIPVDFGEIKLAFKLLAWHEEAQDQPTPDVLNAIEDLRAWCNQIETMTYNKEGIT